MKGQKKTRGGHQPPHTPACLGVIVGSLILPLRYIKKFTFIPRWTFLRSTRISTPYTLLTGGQATRAGRLNLDKQSISQSIYQSITIQSLIKLVNQLINQSINQSSEECNESLRGAPTFC